MYQMGRQYSLKELKTVKMAVHYDIENNMKKYIFADQSLLIAINKTILNANEIICKIMKTLLNKQKKKGAIL